MSLITPTCALRTGSQEWTSQVLSCRVSLCLAPRVDTASFVLPAAAALKADPGDEVSLTLDSGEHASDVFAGQIDRIRRTPSVTVIHAIDAGGVLARTRPAVTFEHITAGDLVKRLCSEAGVDAGDVEDGVSLAYYVADPNATAWQHVARVAGWSGAIVTVSGDNRVTASIVDAEQAEAALRYGREILDCSFESEHSYVDTFATAGESGVGDTAAANALRLTTDFFAGNRPDGPGPKASWRSQPALRTAEAAATAAAARQRLYVSTREAGRLTAFLQPHLRPGSVIEIQDLPAGMPTEPLWVRSVEHALSADGAVTRTTFAKGGDSFDPLALLGSAAAALASLL